MNERQNPFGLAFSLFSQDFRSGHFVLQGYADAEFMRQCRKGLQTWVCFLTAQNSLHSARTYASAFGEDGETNSQAPAPVVEETLHALKRQIASC